MTSEYGVAFTHATVQITNSTAARRQSMTLSVANATGNAAQGVSPVQPRASSPMCTGSDRSHAMRIWP